MTKEMTKHEKLSTSLSILALAVAVIVPVLSATFGFGQFMARMDSGSGKADIQTELKKALQALDERKKQALAAIQDTVPDDRLSQFDKRLNALEKRPRLGFGDWESREVGKVYPAKTDGFLAAYTGGEKPNRTICLETHASDAALYAPVRKGNCSEAGLRTRAGVYDGSVTPVKKGHFYTVHIRKGNKGSVTVYWLPFYN